MFPGGLLRLGLCRKDNGVGRDRPIGSGVKGKIWGRGGVKEQDDNKEYDDGVRYSIRRLGRSLRVFRDGGGISMVIESDCWEGSDAMAEA